MRMISREDLKQRVMGHFCGSCSTPYKDTDILELGEYCCDMVSDTMAFIDELPTLEAEPVKQDSQLSIILQDFGIDNAEQLRYILKQYQKLIQEITGGQMSYLTYPAQAVIECTNDYYLSALADLKESSNNEAEPDNGWISVKDRLPEYDKTVLVVNEDGYMHTAVRIKGSIARIDEWQIKFGVYFIDNDVWEEDEQGKITYWQHLPEPPKGE